MQTTYTRELTVLPSQVDPSGRLGVADTFALFMDTATLAAEALGVGWGFLMRRGLFWITVKTRVCFLGRPRLMDAVRVETWPEAPEALRCTRHYRLSRAGEPLVLGKTEWAIVDIRSGRPQPMAGVMPEGLAYSAEAPSPEPFPMIEGPFDAPPFAEHRVTANDIDMARHMNNVAYVRAIADAFSVRDWQALDVRQMDVVFRASAHEGDVIRFRQRRDGDMLDICGALDGGETAVLARLRAGNAGR